MYPDRQPGDRARRHGWRRLAVEAWAPEYGAPVDEAALSPAAETVDVGVERPPSEWQPLRPAAPAAPPATARFVDGVRRIEARVWLHDDAGAAHQGICASYAAGVIRCDGDARVESIAVRRRVFAPTAVGRPIRCRYGRFEHQPVVDSAPEALSLALQDAMAELEHEVSVAAAEAPAQSNGAGGLLILDGPLRQRHRLVGAVGYIKTHQRSYLPEPLAPLVGALGAGERTPLFLLGGPVPKWSWYVRLPGPADHAWAGIVRGEVSSALAVDEARALADRVTAGLGRFASTAHKDPRAPQNLFPIAGLERELRRRLGDPRLWFRSLREAAAAS